MSRVRKNLLEIVTTLTVCVMVNKCESSEVGDVPRDHLVEGHVYLWLCEGWPNYLPSSHFYEMLHRKVQEKKIELKDRWKLGVG